MQDGDPFFFFLSQREREYKSEKNEGRGSGVEG
jgi:hypothetical protein